LALETCRSATLLVQRLLLLRRLLLLLLLLLGLLLIVKANLRGRVRATAVAAGGHIGSCVAIAVGSVAI